jgi:DNA-binding PucR family transcriptional regulator
VFAAAGASHTPLILLGADSAPQTLLAALQLAAAQCDSHLAQVQLHVQQDLNDLVRAGASRPMVVQRLVETTGKTALLQGRTTLADEIRPAARQDIPSKTLRSAISTTQAGVESWMRGAADQTVANVLYCEVPGQQLVRLVAPVWIEGWMQAAVSIFAEPDELTSRDRVALLLTSRALAVLPAEPVVDLVTPQLPIPNCFPMAAMAIRSRQSRLDAIADALTRILDLHKGGLIQGTHDVRIWLPYRSVDEWNHLVQQAHAQLSASLGTISIGHTFQRSGKREGMASALIQAAEAVLIADRLLGPGHVSSYAEAQLARLLLERSDTTDLSAIYERVLGELAIEDPNRESGLLRTLEVYCETFGTIRTAERLGIHRNTVLHRLKRIEEITATDLDDSPTRLIFQLGLLADRLLRKVDGAGSRVMLGWQPLAASGP